MCPLNFSAQILLQASHISMRCVYIHHTRSIHCVIVYTQEFLCVHSVSQEFLCVHTRIFTHKNFCVYRACHSMRCVIEGAVCTWSLHACCRVSTGTLSVFTYKLYNCLYTRVERRHTRARRPDTAMGWLRSVGSIKL